MPVTTKLYLMQGIALYPLISYTVLFLMLIFMIILQANNCAQSEENPVIHVISYGFFYG